MITATELLDFLSKAQKLGANYIIIQHDDGYSIQLRYDWYDDNNYSKVTVFITNECESTWEKGDYEFGTMNTILGEMVEYHFG